MRHSSIALKPIVEAHYLTLRNSDNKLSFKDQTRLFAIPAISGAIVGIFCIKLSPTTSTALLIVTGIFAAFFFQLSVQLLTRAATWADTKPDPKPATSQYASMLEGLSANSLYAALIAVVTTLTILITIITHTKSSHVSLVALSITLFAHLVATLALIASRVFSLTRARLNAAKTGSELHNEETRL